jgi:hypothetical protein
MGQASAAVTPSIGGKRGQFGRSTTKACQDVYTAREGSPSGRINFATVTMCVISPGDLGYCERRLTNAISAIFEKHRPETCFLRSR